MLIEHEYYTVNRGAQESRMHNIKKNGIYKLNCVPIVFAMHYTKLAQGLQQAKVKEKSRYKFSRTSNHSNSNEHRCHCQHQCHCQHHHQQYECNQEKKKMRCKKN